MEGEDNTGFESGHILPVAYGDVHAAQIHALYGGNIVNLSSITTVPSSNLCLGTYSAR